jgi:hypothetical protein
MTLTLVDGAQYQNQWYCISQTGNPGLVKAPLGTHSKRFFKKQKKTVIEESEEHIYSRIFLERREMKGVQKTTRN